MRDIFTNEYNNHRDNEGNTFDFYHHNNSPETKSVSSGKVMGFRSDEDKKNFALHRKYTMWLVGRPYKQPSFEEWKELQLN